MSDPTLNVRSWDVTSTGRCNTGVKTFCWGFEAQRLARPFIELPGEQVGQARRNVIVLQLAGHRMPAEHEAYLPASENRALNGKSYLLQVQTMENSSTEKEPVFGGVTDGKPDAPHADC